MLRRLAAVLLWSYFAWYLGAMLAVLVSGPAVTGPLAAVLTAAVAVYGWIRRSEKTRRVSPPQPSY